MKTIESMMGEKEKIYVRATDEEGLQQFLRQEEKEGFRFGDGALPTERLFGDLYAVMKNKTLCFCGFVFHLAVSIRPHYNWSADGIEYVPGKSISDCEYDDNISYNSFKKGSVSSMELKGSKTEANLLTAFAGESQARNKYTYYAAKAKKDGYEQIAEIFEKTADNERAHAKIWWSLLTGGAGETKENLIDAAAGENYEWTQMYRDFAIQAREEGFEKIAALFELVGRIEQEHEERFRKLVENIDEGLVFSKDGEKIWICRNCGHIHFGKTAPQICPVCAHPRAFFELHCENY